MTEPLVTLELTESAAIIRLNRPARHNALVPELLANLLETLADDRCRDARTIILAAEGPSFSTGGDLLGFWQRREDIVDYARELVGLLNQVVLSIYTHPAPVTCAVQGQVTGGSFGLLLAADRVFMLPEVSVTPWYSEVGFSPDGGWTALLPGVVGRQRASHWLMTNESVAAAECLELGIAHEIASDGVVDAALAWSSKVAEKSLGSIRQTRSLLGTTATDVARALEAERVAFLEQVQTPEAIAGIARFLGKEIS